MMGVESWLIKPGSETSAFSKKAQSAFVSLLLPNVHCTGQGMSPRFACDSAN
jgi:hypothetical protein